MRIFSAVGDLPSAVYYEGEDMSRVVITGVGAITPIGNDVATFWENMKAGVSGAAPISGFDPAGFSIRIACEVKGFEATDWMDKKIAKRLARSTHFSIAATRQALADAKLEITPENSPRVGLFLTRAAAASAPWKKAPNNCSQRGRARLPPFW